MITLGQAESIFQRYEKLKFSFEIALDKINVGVDEKVTGLRESYTKALTKLESKLQNEGDLKGVVAVRSEIKSIKESGEPNEETILKSVRELREVFLAARRKLETERGTLRHEAVGTYRKKLKGFVTEFTKAGEVKRALALEAEMKELDQVALGDKGQDVDSVRLVKVPTTRPTVVKDPLGMSKWSDSLSFPEGRFDFKKWKNFGKHGGKGTLYLSRKGVYTSKHRHGIQVLGGRLIAEDCQFRGMRLRADHTGSMFFIGCQFTDTTIREHGTWYGYGNYDARFYFENCKIEKRLTTGSEINIYYWGLCMSRCEVNDVELPAIKYKGEPADRRKDQWLRVNRCHFRGCRVPLSFLMITNDCLFTDCKFEDDRGAEPEYKKPFTVTFYTQGCTDSIRKKPDVVTLKNLSFTKLQRPVGQL